MTTSQEYLNLIRNASLIPEVVWVRSALQEYNEETVMDALLEGTRRSLETYRNLGPEWEDMFKHTQDVIRSIENREEFSYRARPGTTHPGIKLYSI